MSFPVFSPSVVPSLGTSVSSEMKVLEVDFGDGYSQRVADGINNHSQDVSLSWNNLSASQALSIENFLTARYGVEAFEYTLPGEQTAKKWTCSKWNKSYSEGGLVSLSCDLKRVYDL